MSGAPIWGPAEPPAAEPLPVRFPAPPDLEIVADGLEFPEGPVWMPDGSVVVVEVRGGRLTRVAPDGAIEPIAELGGGPNGAALGPDGWVYVCNNGGLPWTQLADGSWYPIDPVTGTMQPDGYVGGWIERVHPDTGEHHRVAETVDGVPLSAPNDLCFDRSGALWFTDTGKTDARRTALGAVYRMRADGTDLAPCAFGLPGPNGIGLSPDETRLYVADTPTGRVWSWGVGDLPPGNPRQHGGIVHARLPGAMALDSLAVDARGRVVVALPGSGALAVVEPTGGVWLFEVPDPMPTNVCFSGLAGDRAFVTLGGRGRLATFAWPAA